MTIYTSYFTMAKRLEKEGVTPVCIAIGTPKWFSGLNYKAVSPHGFMLSLSEEKYREEYRKILRGLSAEKVVSDIKTITGNAKKVALLCYEKPGEFCHRRMLAYWFEKELGIEVKEYVFEEKVKTPSLF
ncbi:MAG: DUF488 domain-containing protein [Prevotellaceae bacterium]|nr:DUF488 domain-containing protein [Prevotellaceae bacterium]